jgi:alpha-beta hydrolase superfamily lysophospholipase/SAM-dependent methyltransferase
MRSVQESHFQARDGVQLFYRHWPAIAETHRAIILLHRGHEHSGRIMHLVDELNMPDYALFAWDARGHGLSHGIGEGNPAFGTFVNDLDHFARHISTEHGVPVENIALIAQSVGAVIAATWVHDYAPNIRCLILATPAFQVKLYVPLARTFLGLAGHFSKNLHVNSYVRASALTHDPERIASYGMDPLIRRPISVKVLLGLYSTASRIIEDAAAIQTPTQLLISGKDWVVHQRPQHRFFERLGSPAKERHVFEGFYHDTLGEKDRHLAIAKVRDFLLRMFAQPPVKPRLLDADQGGFTRTEFDRLREPLSWLSPKRAWFAISRFGLRTAGRLSEGIRLGLKTGFDSGSTLDYVYRNRAAGITPIGKMIDWSYVNSIGWRGIRVRRLNIERLLGDAMDLLRREGRSVRVLDIAAGHGRYVLEAIEKKKRQPDSVLLRDYSPINVEAGQRMIREKKMEGFARFIGGDAFNRPSLATVVPQPTLGVVSGLYELFPENAMVRESLAGLADAIQPGGYLVYTDQPWHPQLEMIARVLPSHRDFKPWVMRRRTQGEMDQLVEAAGFRKIDQAIDDWGIFTVSLAERI